MKGNQKKIRIQTIKRSVRSNAPVHPAPRVIDCIEKCKKKKSRASTLQSLGAFCRLVPLYRV
jgi:hypothetical protein